MLGEVGKEAPSSDTHCLADFAGRFAGVFIQNLCVLQLRDIGSWTPSGFSSGPCRSPSCGRTLGAQFAFHLMDCAHHRQKAPSGGGTGIDSLAQRDEIDLVLLQLLRCFKQMEERGLCCKL